MAEPHRAWLRCPSGPLRGDRHEIQEGATIGRTATHDIVLDHKLISSDHARFVFDPEGACFAIEDLGSTNGTWVDGIAIQGRTRLGHLHVITFADVHEFVFLDPVRAAHRHGMGVPVRERDADQERVGDQAPDTGDASITRVHELPQAIPGPLAAALAASAVPPPSSGEVTSIIDVLPMVPEGLLSTVSTSDSARDGVSEVEDDPVREGDENRPAPSSSSSSSSVEPREAVATSTDLANEIEALMRGATPDSIDGSVAAPAEPRSPQQSEPAGLDSAHPFPSAPRPTPAPSAFVLEVVTLQGVSRFRLQGGENLVGRSREAVVRLTAPELSRRHAIIEVAGPSVRVHDLGSRHCTYFEGFPIQAIITIEAGDRLRFGTIEARLVRTESEDDA